MLPVRARQTSWAVAVMAALLATRTARAEDVATSCADCPNYTAAFSIRNDTGQTIKYQRRWGDRSQWTQMVLQTGRMETHTYPLGDDPHGKVPTPYVRFDDVANDGRTTFKEYRMEFFATGYAGYGPRVNRTEPKRYHFRYAPDGRHLDLLAD